MKITKELRSLAAEDLHHRLGDVKKELLKLNSQRATGTNPSTAGRLRQLRRNTARILTIQRQQGGS